MSVDTPKIVSLSKRISGPLSWSRNGDEVQIVSALEDAAGITIEDLYMRIKARSDMRERAVMVQLEYPQTDRSDRAIYRIDWRPLHNHQNNQPGPAPELYGKLIIGSHIHAFEYNWLDGEKRLLCHNLPIAAAMNPEPPNYAELLKVAAGYFVIENLNTSLVPAPWKEPEPTLFNGNN